ALRQGQGRSVDKSRPAGRNRLPAPADGSLRMPDLLAGRCLITAAATPLTEALEPDPAALLAHCRGLLAAGCDGVALFGTTGEGPHFGVEPRRRTLERIIAGGMPVERIVVSASATALDDAVALTRHAVDCGVTAILLMPPFFLRAATAEAGVERFYDTVIERCASPRLRLMLYHFPDIAGFGLSPDLVGRIVERHGATIAGIKDSGGKLEETLVLVRAFPGLGVLSGTEVHLPQVLAAGGAGTICGLGNVLPALLRRLIDRPALAPRLVPAIQAMDDLICARP